MSRLITRRRSLITAAGIVSAPHVARAQFFNPPMFFPTKSSGFNPTSLITGAGGFWEADKGVTGNPNVTAWADQSSFANNLTGSANPQFSSTGWLSAFPGITFSGSNAVYSTTFTFGSSSTVSFFVLISRTNAASNNRFMGFGGNASEFNTPHQFAFTSNSNTYQANLTGSPVSCGDPGTGTAALVGGVFDGANFTGWKNAVSQSTGACSDTFTTTGFALLASDSTPDNATAAVLAFAGVTQKAMNQTDWTNLKNYCNSTWGTSL